MKKNLLDTFFALTLCLFLASCQSQPTEDKGQRYELRGTVVSVDRERQSLVISHEDIKDYMEGMTMPFKLKDAWPLDVVKPGDEVQATLVVTDTSHWLENVVVVQKTALPAEAAGNSAQPKPGDHVPDFHLVNQDGKTVSMAEYRGRAVLVTFIYTRCPVPEYCTLMSNNFAEIERELKKDAALYKQTHLLSVSFDPEYDTPKVLRSYGASHTGNYDRETFAHWEFVTGDKEEIGKITKFFGLTSVPEKGQIVHSLQTALISADGKLVKLYSGNEWKPAEVLQDVRALFDKAQQQ